MTDYKNTVPLSRMLSPESIRCLATILYQMQQQRRIEMLTLKGCSDMLRYDNAQGL